MKRRTLLAGAALAAAMIAPAPGLRAQEPADIAKRLIEAASPLGDRVLGKADAPVTVVEYASATCPHCAEFHQLVLPQIKTDYIDTGKVRFIFREFPLDQLALGAFMLARCVPEDKYFPVLDLMFRRQATWAKAGNPADELFKIMRMAGMNEAGFEACINRKELSKALVAAAKKAKQDFAIKGTPAIFVNGTYIDAHEEMTAVKAAIDKALAR
jgi:protein-disulfide isomerase